MLYDEHNKCKFNRLYLDGKKRNKTNGAYRM